MQIIKKRRPRIDLDIHNSKVFSLVTFDKYSRLRRKVKMSSLNVVLKMKWKRVRSRWPGSLTTLKSLPQIGKIHEHVNYVYLMKYYIYENVFLQYCCWFGQRFCFYFLKRLFVCCFCCFWSFQSKVLLKHYTLFK